MKSYNILIVGYGVVGKALHEEIAELEKIEGFSIHIKDIKGNIGYDESIEYDVAFTCVNADISEESGMISIDNVIEAISNSNARIHVVKSTLPINGYDAIVNGVDSSKRIVYSPEWHGATPQSIDRQEFVILSGDRSCFDEVASLYYYCKKSDFKVTYASVNAAEIAKLAENTFLALKVTFCNELADIASKHNVSYPELRELFLLDNRIGRSHTFVHPEQPYYDSVCLNKDTTSLIKQCKDDGINIPLLDGMISANSIKKQTFNNEI